MEATSGERFVQLDEEQSRILYEDPDEGVPASLRVPKAMSEPTREEVDASQKLPNLIKIVSYGENMSPLGSKEMERPPMSDREELEREVLEGASEIDDRELAAVGMRLDEIAALRKRAAKTRPSPGKPGKRKKSKKRRKTERAREESVEERRRSADAVTFTGVFGTIKSKYLDVYREGIYLILVEDLEAEAAYAPPPGDDPLRVETPLGSFLALSQGLGFDMSSQGVRTTILFITEE